MRSEELNVDHQEHMLLYPQIFYKTQISHSTDADYGYLLYRFQQFTVGKM